MGSLSAKNASEKFSRSGTFNNWELFSGEFPGRGGRIPWPIPWLFLPLFLRWIQPYLQSFQVINNSDNKVMYAFVYNLRDILEAQNTGKYCRFFVVLVELKMQPAFIYEED